jgi:hypothetical protein
MMMEVKAIHADALPGKARGVSNFKQTFAGSLAVVLGGV